MQTFIYPGSFDPFTNGHLDIAIRARNLCDRLIVAVATNSAKRSLFSVEERLVMMEEVLDHHRGIEVTSFDGLLMDFASKCGAKAVVRGIRAVTDYEYEYAMSLLNREMSPEIETLFLLANKEYSFLSSTMIKEVARYGRVSTQHAPDVVNRALLAKFGHKA